MNIIFIGKQLDIETAVKDYTKGKINKFEKFTSYIHEATVTLSAEKYRHRTEILLNAKGVLIQAESITNDVYSSIDETLEKLERQLKKYKEKIVSRRKEKKVNEESYDVETFKDEYRRIIKKKQLSMKPMSPEEAAMQIDLLDKTFFVFTNDQSGDINVIYKINDDNFGLIEPVK